MTTGKPVYATARPWKLSFVPKFSFLCDKNVIAIALRQLIALGPMGLRMQMNNKYILGSSRAASREDDIFEWVVCSSEISKEEQESLTSSRLASCPQFHSNFSWTFLSKGKGAMRLSLCETSTRETRPDHNTGSYVPYSFLLAILTN